MWRITTTTGYCMQPTNSYDGFPDIKSPMYLRDAEDFTDVFPKLLEVMDDLYDDFLYEYENATLCGE